MLRFFLARSNEKFENEVGDDQEFRVFGVAKSEEEMREKAIIEFKKTMEDVYEHTIEKLYAMTEKELKDAYYSAGCKELQHAIEGAFSVEEVSGGVSNAFACDAWV
jgi:tRNA A37 N6-isopentenylltransferase MiaA